TEFVEQTFGDLVGPTESADLLAQQQHCLIPGHLRSQTVFESLPKSHLGHGCLLLLLRSQMDMTVSLGNPDGALFTSVEYALSKSRSGSGDWLSSANSTASSMRFSASSSISCARFFVSTRLLTSLSRYAGTGSLALTSSLSSSDRYCAGSTTEWPFSR